MGLINGSAARFYQFLNMYLLVRRKTCMILKDYGMTIGCGSVLHPYGVRAFRRISRENLLMGINLELPTLPNS